MNKPKPSLRIIAGKYRSQMLFSVPGLSTRPTSEKVRGAIFNMCHMYLEGSSFLDLFAGSGANGIEALSRGASSVTFVEKSRDAISCIQENLKKIKGEQGAILLPMDIEKALEKLEGKHFDFILADPPYGLKESWSGREDYLANHILNYIDHLDLANPKAWIFIEESFDTPVKIEWNTLEFSKRKDFGKTSLYLFKKI